jgi:osmotically-inducible protein OsmY
MTAERATKSVYGVKGVANDIEVKIPGTIQRTDAEIAAAALNALHWDAVVPDDRIRVTVRDGWVAREGDAQWQYQRDAAERDVRNLTGVRGVTDQITLKSRAQPGEVKQKIEAAFRRSAEVDARRVRVEARDGKVILHGNVRSFAEREEAQQAAWAAPGVVEVDNRLSVIP